MNLPFLRRGSSFLNLFGGSETLTKSVRRTAGKRRRLGFEQCEDRHLLSGASITGIKFDTVSSSGFTPVGTPHDVPLAGVFIDLFKDNGDGTFNPGTDTMVDRQATAAGTGAYTFANVADGTYFIQEEVPTGYTQSAGPPFYTVTVVGGLVYANTTSNVDDFSDPNPAGTYFINAIDANPFTLNSVSAGAIGGQRNLTVNVLGPSNPISASGFVGVVGTDHGVFNLGSAANGPGTEVSLLYNANGAGLAANLTTGGNNGIRLDFNFLQVGTGTTSDFHISAVGPGGTANFSTNITENPGGFSLFVPFSAFSTTGAFSFANVSSLQFNFNQSGVADVDFELSQIVDVQQRSTGFDFGNFPNASCLSGFVYVDSNNNGNKDVGEPPIANVIVTLTGTNDLGQSVTQSTLTNGTGAYIFNNLRPGVYKLTETQPINFIDGKDTIGTPGGTTSNDMFSNINLPAGFCGMNNNFGELGLTPPYATKRSLLYPAQPVALVGVYPAGYTPPVAVATSGPVAFTPAMLSTPTTASTPSNGAAPVATPIVIAVPTTTSTTASTAKVPAVTTPAPTPTVSTVVPKVVVTAVVSAPATTSSTSTPKVPTPPAIVPAVTTNTSSTSTAKPPAATSVSLRTLIAPKTTGH